MNLAAVVWLTLVEVQRKGGQLTVEWTTCGVVVWGSNQVRGWSQVSVLLGRRSKQYQYTANDSNSATDKNKKSETIKKREVKVGDVWLMVGGWE